MRVQPHKVTPQQAQAKSPAGKNPKMSGPQKARQVATEAAETVAENVSQRVKGGKAFQLFEAGRERLGEVAKGFFQGSVFKGIGRMLRKTLLRPVGWIELVATFFTGIPFFLKHFIEGLVGVDSIILKRKKSATNWLTQSVQFEGRTLVDAFKGLFKKGIKAASHGV